MSSINSSSPAEGPEPLPDEPPPEAPPAPPSPAADFEARLAAVNRPGEPSALERHIRFFDTKGDGMITVAEVREGLERLGMKNLAERTFDSALNNVLLGPSTQSGLASITNFGKIDVANITKARHAGDTGIFDAQGRFDPQKFQETWARFDKDGDGRLTESEINAMVAENTKDTSVFSRAGFSAKAEFALMLEICGSQDAKGERFMTKDRMLSFYDGSLFPKLAAEVAATGAIDRSPAHADGVPGASGPLPGLARAAAGPAAGPAAGARYGAAALEGAAAPGGPGASAVLAAMMTVCPYAGMLAGGGAKPG